MKKTPNIQFTIFNLFFAAFIGTGCAPTERVKHEEDKSATELYKYEITFNPADYDPEIPFEPVMEPAKEPVIPETPTTEPEATEVVSGFRVQVSFTDNIEQANRIKREVSNLIVDQGVYVVYEAPYYKVRVGDYLNRPEANDTHRTLTENGYKDAWIVPDKVKQVP